MSIIDGLSSVELARYYSSGRMEQITFEDFVAYSSGVEHVKIGGEVLRLKIEPPSSLEPEDFTLESTTVWSFPERGKWATHAHNARYRGNWAPQVPRNLILRYTEPGDLVLDPFVGSGTTLIECVLLKRRCIGVDININAVMLTWSRLQHLEEARQRVRLYVGDARNLEAIEDSSVDLIVTHPPYANIIRYSERGCSKGDLSHAGTIEEFVRDMRDVAKEMFRVLRPGGHAAVMIGDTRRRKFIVPVSYRVLDVFLSEGFAIREHIIKVQHNMRGTKKWARRDRDFLLLAHEHIFVFRKLAEGEEKLYKLSLKWW
ncbi:MAG: DNA methyltransferase [Fervidicoccaceae archaeon]